MSRRELTLREVVESARHLAASRGAASESDLDRFYSKIDVAPSGCWLWTGAYYSHRGERTYGQFWIGERRISAHRASFLIHNGEWVEGLDVMHSCDVKACVNPAHLSLGTRSQNLRDAKKSDPSLWAGERNGNSRLDWAKVRAIRAAQNTTKASVLATRHGVSETHIRLIWRGLKWPEQQQGEVAA